MYFSPSSPILSPSSLSLSPSRPLVPFFIRTMLPGSTWARALAHTTRTLCNVRCSALCGRSRSPHPPPRLQTVNDWYPPKKPHTYTHTTLSLDFGVQDPNTPPFIKYNPVGLGATDPSRTRQAAGGTAGYVCGLATPFTFLAPTHVSRPNRHFNPHPSHLPPIDTPRIPTPTYIRRTNQRGVQCLFFY